MPDLDALLAAARDLLPADVGIGVSDPRLTYPVWQGEELPNAVPERQAEFSAGRAAARMALREVGHPEQAILKGEDRAPLWPKGVIGSISHSRSACIAAVSPALSGLGLDLEDEKPLRRDLWPRILSAAETSWVQGQSEPELAALLIFSAKEAVYKAQYRHSLVVFDFDTLEVEVAGQAFTACFAKDIVPFPKGFRLHGGWRRAAGQILTACLF